jgi:hypothetical protein
MAGVFVMLFSWLHLLFFALPIPLLPQQWPINVFIVSLFLFSCTPKDAPRQKSPGKAA